MACQIKRDNTNNIIEVLAPNGKPSMLYDTLKSKLVNPAFKQVVTTDKYVSSILDTEYFKDNSNEEIALAAWSKAYTASFVDSFGNWKADKLPNTDNNGEPLVSTLFKVLVPFSTDRHRSIAALKDLSYKIANRIGGEVEFENNPNVDWKGYNKGMTSVLNIAHMTPDTPFHEILAHPIIKAIKKTNTKLYDNLLKELEYGVGKDVLNEVKSKYINKQVYDRRTDKYVQKNYTLEEQQEEAIVELLGLMAADKLDTKQNATLISKLKELWKQISDFVKRLLLQDEIRIDELPITTTLNDLAEIMGYGNNKIILPNYKIEYSTPLGNKYDTLEEVNNEIKSLASLDTDVKLENITPQWLNAKLKKLEKFENKSEEGIVKKISSWFDSSDKEKKEIASIKIIRDFIVKNKEYEQSREIIERWKKENDIQYDPEEVYSRGHEFYHIKDAYYDSARDTLSWVQSLLSILNDYEKAGTKIELSFSTAPKGNVGQGIEVVSKRIKQGTFIYIVAYPKSEDIIMASKTDNHTSSFGQLNGLEKAFTDKNNITTGIALTKSVPLRNLSTIEPNLADTIDSYRTTYTYNESVIALTKNNFRIRYGENVPYEVKQIINQFNKILDDKYGKLIEPEVEEKINFIGANATYDGDSSFKIINTYLGGELRLYDISNGKKTIKGLNASQFEFEIIKGKKPIKTRNNTTDIQSIKQLVVSEVEDSDGSGIFGYYANGIRYIRYFNKEYSKSQGDTWIEITKEEYESNKPKTNIKEKEYISQAVINFKVAALKEAAKKYPRSLITSRVVLIDEDYYDENEDVFQKILPQKDLNQLPENLTVNDITGLLFPSRQTTTVESDLTRQDLNTTQPIKPGVEFVFEQTPELSSIGTQEQYSQYLDTVFPDSKVKDIVYHGTVGTWFKKEKFALDKGSKKTTNKSNQYGYWFGENKQVATIFNSVDLKSLASDLKTNVKLFEEKLNIIQETYKISDDEIDIIVQKTIEYMKASSTDYSKQFHKPSTSNTISVIINAVNPDRVDTLRFAGSTRGDGQNALDYLNTFKGDSLIFEQVEDAGPGGEEFEFGKNYAVKTSEQIHILGSNSDIQQFKQYVQTSSGKNWTNVKNNCPKL